jgi:hypothetical protein
MGELTPRQQRQPREGEVIGERVGDSIFDLPQHAEGEERLGAVLFHEKGTAPGQHTAQTVVFHDRARDPEQAGRPSDRRGQR